MLDQMAAVMDSRPSTFWGTDAFKKKGGGAGPLEVRGVGGLGFGWLLLGLASVN